MQGVAQFDCNVRVDQLLVRAISTNEGDVSNYYFGSFDLVEYCPRQIGAAGDALYILIKMNRFANRLLYIRSLL